MTIPAEEDDIDKISVNNETPPEDEEKKEDKAKNSDVVATDMDAELEEVSSFVVVCFYIKTDHLSHMYIYHCLRT